MTTASRRTPPPLRDGRSRMLAAATAASCGTGRGENPYLALLALADAIVVTADSSNMVGEAAATGAPDPGLRAVRRPSQARGLPCRRLSAMELCTTSPDALKASRYAPLDSTPIIAEAVRTGLARHRRALDLPEPG